MLNRKQFHFPPFVNLIQITLKHKQAEAVNDCAIILGNTLRTQLGNSILGPTTPVISKVRNMYLRQILIKLKKEIL